MKLDRNKLVAELYEKYIFVSKRGETFRKIVLDSITDDITYEEALEIGKKNIINNIIYRMNNNLFIKLFNRTVKAIGIERTFDFYNAIVQETGMKINTYDIIKISKKDEYSPFFEKINPKENKLLEDFLYIYNSDIDIGIDPSKFLKSEDRKYINYIEKNYKLLESREEELKLISKYRQTQDVEYKDQFINSNLRLVVNMAFKQYSHQTNMKLSLLDLIQAGNIGLVKAFDKFDENKGFRFSTFAIWWIKSEIMKLIYSENETIRIPAKMFINIAKINRFKEKYMYKHGVEASKEEIMNYMDINEEELNELKRIEIMRNTLSYDIAIYNNFEDEDNIDITNLIEQISEIEYLEENNFDEEECVNAIDLIPDEESIRMEDAIINDFFRDQMLAYANRVLNPKENKIILEKCGFNEEQTAKEYNKIARNLNVTAQRIKQIEKGAIYKLQKHTKRINNGVKVKQEYFTIKDIKKILKQNNITNIRIVDHSLHRKISTFKCIECNQEFNAEAKDFIETLECPYCREDNKQLIKK